jgi:putative phage-type endonuclease
MNIIDLEQRSDAWLEWKKSKISASEIAIVMGLSPYETPWRLWATKKGLLAEKDLNKNPLVKQGVVNEDRIRRITEEETGLILMPICAEHDKYSVISASFDGLDTDDPVPYEFKWPSDKVWDSIIKDGENSEAYKLYYPQVQVQIFVVGEHCQEGILIFGHDEEDGMQRRSFTVKRDDAFLRDMLDKVIEFKQKIIDNTPPDIDIERDLFIPGEQEERMRWASLAKEAKEIDSKLSYYMENIDPLEKRKKAIRQEAINMMGAYLKSDLNGLAITRYAKDGSIDWKKLIAEKLPSISEDEIEQYRNKSSMQSRMMTKDKSQYDDNRELFAVSSNMNNSFF